jgi:hypothetical protein
LSFSDILKAYLSEEENRQSFLRGMALREIDLPLANDENPIDMNLSPIGSASSPGRAGKPFTGQKVGIHARDVI